MTNGNVQNIATITPGNAVNAIGYYSDDGYMYGYDSTTNQICKIGIDGALQDLFSVPNLPAQIYNIGDIDDNGYYYFIIGASTTMYVVDLNPGRPGTYGQLVDANTKALTTTGTTLSGSIGGAVIGTGDWAFSPIDGQLYYVKNSDGIVRKVNPLNGVVTQLTTNTAVTGQFGGIFFDPAGNLYASDNNAPNNIYKYVISGTTATRSLLSSISGGSGGGDGARCRYAPIYFATIDDPAVKTATPYANVGNTITYTIVLNNIGNIAAANLTLIDTLPQGTTFINNSVTLNGVSKAGNPNPVSGINVGTLPVGVSTITFLALASSIPNPNPTPNTGSFTYEFTDPTTGTLYNDSVQSTAASTTIVDLTVTSTKVVSKNIAQIGDILTYTIVFTSTGNVTTSTLTFIDTIPNGTIYVINSLKQDGTNIAGSPNPPGANLTSQLTGNDVSTVTFQVQITTVPTSNPISNTAFLSYTYIKDPAIPSGVTNTSNSNITSTTVVSTLISLLKSVDKLNSTCGDTLNYSLILTNNGNVSLWDTILLDTIPSTLLFINNSVFIDSVNVSGVNPQNGLNLGSILVNQAKTITFQAIVKCN